MVAKALLLFDGFLSLIRSRQKALTPRNITKAREYATKAVAVWQTMKVLHSRRIVWVVGE
jgi:hypothetical protein